MIGAKTLVTAAAAFACASQPTAARAQTTCLSQAEVSALAIYSVPALVESVGVRCRAQLPSGGFLARQGGAFSARYARLQNGAWPVAKAGLLKVAAGKSGGSAQTLGMLANLPDDTVRPLLNALIVQEATARIVPDQCAAMERVLEALAPVEPAAAGNLLGAILGVAAPRDLPVCTASRQ